MKRIQIFFLWIFISKSELRQFLPELEVTAFVSQLVTYEKLEYLLELCELKPDDLGIKKEYGTVFPSDEELDSIMEE